MVQVTEEMLAADLLVPLPRLLPQQLPLLRGHSNKSTRNMLMYVAPQSTSDSFSNIVLVEEQRLGEGCPVGMRLRDRNIVLRLCSRRASSVSFKKINQENKCLVPATSEHSQQHLTVVRQNSCNSFSSIRTHRSPGSGFPGFLHCRIVGGHTGSDLQTSTGSQISR